MRRGAALAESNRRRPVAADVDDLEGGGGGPTGYYNPQAKGSFVRTESTSSSTDGMSTGVMDADPMGISSSSSLPTGDYSAGKQKKHRRYKHSSFFSSDGFSPMSFLTNQSPKQLQLFAVILMVTTAVLCPFLPIEYSILTLVYASCGFGTIASLWLAQRVLSCDNGTAEMRAVSDPIREGAEGFLHVQYSAIARFALPLAGLIVLSYQFRPWSSEAVGVAVLGNRMLGAVAAAGFVAGALCSALSGYTAMWVAAQSNIRVASASRRSYGEALVVCFRGGAFSAVLNLTLCIGGVTSLYAILHIVFATGKNATLTSTDIPMLLVGYGFGASFVALFMQLGGGIYTKAADVGADLVGKVEQSIPEDDPRNPAVVAGECRLLREQISISSILILITRLYFRSCWGHGGRLCGKLGRCV
jgi:Inorganic H+ pyrophosphatase